MFVSTDQIESFTGKKRHSAQARFLAARSIRFTERDDGSIALRQEELDRHTLSRPPEVKRRRTLDLAYLRRAG